MAGRPDRSQRVACCRGSGTRSPCLRPIQGHAARETPSRTVPDARETGCASQRQGGRFAHRRPGDAGLARVRASGLLGLTLSTRSRSALYDARTFAGVGAVCRDLLESPSIGLGGNAGRASPRAAAETERRVGQLPMVGSFAAELRMAGSRRSRRLPRSLRAAPCLTGSQPCSRRVGVLDAKTRRLSAPCRAGIPKGDER